jgi:hypothetical protein
MAFVQYWHYCEVGGHVPRVGKKIFNGGLVRRLQEWNRFEDTEMNLKLILKLNLQNYNKRLRTRFILRRIWKKTASFEQGNEFSGLRKY